ncbi:MAG: PEP-CTERM sorting domain-containing protein [Phycisphaeraceae bacterium]|nr:PEP-CTERM sorting domain-containing protein [Phycisphaeraceae bacterium]
MSRNPRFASVVSVRLWWAVLVAVGVCGQALLAPPAWGQDLSRVPGVVISYIEAPPRIFNIPYNEEYVASPSITIMPDGSYITSHDLFHGSGNTNNRYTWVFRSTDKGQTWTKQAEITDAFWSTVFQHNGDLYLLGPRCDDNNQNGDLLIRKSTDYGVTWTNPVDANSGLLRSGDYGGTPNSPVIYNNRIWIAQSGKRVFSAPVSSNLLLSSSWTLSNSANTDNGPLGAGLTISEAQVVASPQTGVVLLPKIGENPNTVLLRVASASSMINPTTADWVSLPGGEKKFGALYDPVSQKFYVLDNPVLDVHRGVTTAALTRTAAAMLSSKDLVNWDVDKIFLFSSHIDNGTYGEAFQYLNGAIDGDDLAVVSRTAFDTDGDASMNGERLPPRGHDSNLMTFHMIEDFRSAIPDHYLKIESGTVKRYERTGNEDAPLGTFALGSSFAGAALTNPNGLATDAQGNVYIRETGGRMLKFDAAGDFISTVASLPGGSSWTSGTQTIIGPNRDQRAWLKNANGDWADPLNWLYWGRPDTNQEIATFGSAIGSARTISANTTYTIKGLRFISANKYTLAGSGSLTLNADSGNALIDVQSGSHEVQLPMLLNSSTDVSLASGSTLLLTSTLNLNGKTLNVSGPGTLTLGGTVQMTGSTIHLQNNSTLAFNSPFATLASGSKLSGVGSVNAILLSYGLIEPGDSSGTLWLNGGYAQSTSGQLDIAIEGASSYGALAVVGMANLDGKLSLNLEGGYVPAYGSSFSVMLANTINGKFATIDGVSISSNLSLAVTYSATAVLVTAALPGDANLDGLVNLSDLQILGDNWTGTSRQWSLGDFNGDGNVNLSDLQIVGDHWGGSAADLAAFMATIPEPGSLLLLGLGGLALLRNRGRA